MSKQSKYKLNQLRKEQNPEYKISLQKRTELRPERHNLEELARMVRENPALTDALTVEERGDLIKAGVYQANLEDPWVQKALKQAQKQDNLCSICGQKFEGTGHNAEPVARGRCCRSCDLKTVIPARERRLDAGYEYERIPGTPYQSRDWSKPMGRMVKPEQPAMVKHTPGLMVKTNPDVHEALNFIGDNLEDGELRERVHAPREIAPNEARVDRTPAGAGKSPGFTPKIRRDPETQIRLPSMNDLVKENLISDIPQTMERLMSEHAPELMQKFYPRIYENVGRYHSPRQCAAFFANMCFETATLGYHRAPTAYRLLLPALEPMARRGMPMFFIAPDLLKAIQLTDFHDDIDWTTLKIPYEQGVFILPKGALTHQEDGDVAMIVWLRLKKGMVYPAPLPSLPLPEIGNDAFVILGLCLKNGIWYDSVFNAEVRPTIRLHNMFYREAGERTPESMKFTNLDADLTNYDEEFLEKLGVIVFGTFLAMNAKPELVEKGKLLKRVVKAKDEVKEFWSPNIIGPRYRLKREVPRINRYGKFAADQPKRDLGGTHASPRFHWRRGHWRNQAYGKGYKERKQLWIEPIAIGLQTDEDAAEGAGA